MAAGGFRTFIPGEVLLDDLINDFLMQGILVFDDATARDAAITAPVEGQFVFLKDTDVTQFFDGTDFVALETGGKLFEHLCIGGGGGGGCSNGSGGGAGGYHSSVAGENSGGGVSAINAVFFLDADEFLVSIGAGGAARSTSGDGNPGTHTIFYQIEAQGGGRGASTNSTGGPGGSGGGAGASGSLTLAGGVARVQQGFAGGVFTLGVHGSPAGGGGASAIGGSGVGTTGGVGGAGVSSSITGSSVARVGGGGGGGTFGGAGGTGGGGAGGTPAIAGVSGIANTGGGGGGSITNGVSSGAGGSGVVILKYPDTVTLTVGGGLTSSTATSGDFKVTTFTAGTDTVTVSI